MLDGKESEVAISRSEVAISRSEIVRVTSIGKGHHMAHPSSLHLKRSRHTYLLLRNRLEISAAPG